MAGHPLLKWITRISSNENHSWFYPLVSNQVFYLLVTQYHIMAFASVWILHPEGWQLICTSYDLYVVASNMPSAGYFITPFGWEFLDIHNRPVHPSVVSSLLYLLCWKVGFFDVTVCRIPDWWTNQQGLGCHLAWGCIGKNVPRVRVDFHKMKWSPFQHERGPMYSSRHQIDIWSPCGMVFRSEFVEEMLEMCQE